MLGKPIGVGIIGLGKSGWDIHVREMRQRSDFKVAAVVDPMPERREEAISEFGCSAYESPDELFRDENVELVVVATPSHTHAELAISALRAGKHVLVEKPMAMNVQEVDRMIEASEAAGKLLTVYQIRRLDPDFLKVKEVIASGVLGPISLIRMARHSYNRRRDWQTLRKLGGGALNNWGSHIIDQGLELLNFEYDSFFADMRNLVSAGDAEDHIKVVLKTKDLVVDVEISGAIAIPGPHWLVVGKYGTLSGSGNKLIMKYYNPAEAPELLPAEEGTLERKYTTEQLPWVEEKVEVSAEAPARQVFYDKLRDSLRDGKPLLVTPQSVRRQINLFDEIRAETGF